MPQTVGLFLLLLHRLPKLPGPFESYNLGNLGSLGSNNEIQNIYIHQQQLVSSLLHTINKAYDLEVQFIGLCYNITDKFCLFPCTLRNQWTETHI